MKTKTENLAKPLKPGQVRCVKCGRPTYLKQWPDGKGEYFCRMDCAGARGRDHRHKPADGMNAYLDFCRSLERE